MAGSHPVGMEMQRLDLELEQKKRDSARAAVLPPSPLSDMTVKLC
jgi:hypothetical protein